MNKPLAKHIFRLATLSIALVGVSSADAQTIRSVSTFATGTAVNATGPDSVALANNSVWVSYTNATSGTGGGGNSTVVQYNFNGTVRHTYSIVGSVDGLKVNPENGIVWALQNQDGNSTLTLIDPQAKTTTGPIPYAVTSSANGFDDVVFRFDKIFLSYTNPASPSDPTIQLLQNGSNPLAVTPILFFGASGTNLATGTVQTTSMNDPDSLKLTPNGNLMLSSGDDGQLIFVSHPGEPNQSVSFLTLLDPSSGAHVSGLDDAVFATAKKGTFYLADTGNNRVLKIDAEDLPIGSLYASVGSLKELALVDLKTGNLTAFLSGLNGPHGIQFLPNADEDDETDNTNQ